MLQTARRNSPVSAETGSGDHLQGMDPPSTEDLGRLSHLDAQNSNDSVERDGESVTSRGR